MSDMLLRKYIHNVLIEACWEDPAVVIAARHDGESDDHDDDDAHDELSPQSKKLDAEATKNAMLAQRDTYGRANSGLATAKVTAPKGGSGPMSGRQPGNTRAGPQGHYHRGY
jgi:hypothetical protein